MLGPADRARIVYSLCYNGSILDVGSREYNNVFNDRLLNMNEYTEAQVINLLDQIEAIESKLNASPGASNVKRIDDIEFDTGMSTRLIEKEAWRLRKRLSLLVDIPSQCGGGGMIGVCQ